MGTSTGPSLLRKQGTCEISNILKQFLQIEISPHLVLRSQTSIAKFQFLLGNWNQNISDTDDSSRKEKDNSNFKKNVKDIGDQEIRSSI